MGGDWRKILLGQIAEDLTVGHVGPMAAEYVPSGIPFLRSQNVEPFRLDFSDVKYISPDFHKKLKKSALLPGDVVIVRTGKPGTAAVVPHSVGDLNCSDLVIVRPGTKLDSKFLCYYINGIAQRHVDAHLVGAVQQHFNVGSARQLPLRLPPITEQRAIAHILGTLDDKIELNRRMNETLEAMARALFKSWFVDFDPVRTKAQGQTPLGMDPDTAALFPRDFVDSQMGEIPKSWRVLPLSEISSYLRRGISPKYIDNDGVLVLNQKCIRGGAINLAPGRRHDSEKKAINGRELQVWDILVNSTGVGTLGRVAQVRELPETTIVDSHVTIVRAASKVVTPHYLGTFLLRAEPDIEALGEGSTGQTELSRARLGALNVVVPDLPVQRCFDQFVLPVRLQQAGNQRENECLATLRDTLLPRLLSGEISIKHAKKAVEATV